MFCTYHDSGTIVIQFTWESTDINNVQTQESRVTTATSGASVFADVVTRVKNQVTGFNLPGGRGGGGGSSNTEGPPLNSCPDGSNLSTVAGPPVVVSHNNAQSLAVSDATDGLSPAATALDGLNVWHLANGLNPVTGSVNYGTANGSVY
jgi:hypothetical protein